MKIDILTLFPEMFEGPFSESILRRAQDKLLVEIKTHNLRKWAIDKHNTVDDRPYGGGAGMIIRVDVVDAALQQLRTMNLEHGTNKGSKFKVQGSHVVLLSPQGTKFNQSKAKELSKLDHIILIAGHYEGFDERIKEHLVDEEISIGDYVLTGGELPAMVVTDSIIRLIPGVLGDSESLTDETHSKQSTVNPTSLKLRRAGNKFRTNIKYPVYTRPEEFNGWKVPEVLLSGNHKEIKEWRASNSKKTDS